MKPMSRRTVLATALAAMLAAAVAAPVGAITITRDEGPRGAFSLVDTICHAGRALRLQR